MLKENYIKEYGQEAWRKKLQWKREWRRNNPKRERQRVRDWREEHPEEEKESQRLWRLNNPDKVKTQRGWSRKGGKYYEKKLKYNRTGLQGKRSRIRMNHCYHYRPYKKIIAPDSQIHHQWLPETANYRGVALVEKDQHRYGIIDVIQILEGEITLLTEDEIKRGGTE